MSSFKESNGNNSLLSDTSISSDNLNFVGADENFGSPNAPTLTNKSDKITEAMWQCEIMKKRLSCETRTRVSPLNSEFSTANAKKFRLNCLNQALQVQAREKEGQIDKQEKLKLEQQIEKLQQKNETLNGQLLELQERYRVEVTKLLSTHCDSDTRVC